MNKKKYISITTDTLDANFQSIGVETVVQNMTEVEFNTMCKSATVVDSDWDDQFIHIEIIKK